MRHLLVQAIQPRLSLGPCLERWDQISFQLREAPRRRNRYRPPEWNSG